jgi:hypothetical protein
VRSAVSAAVSDVVDAVTPSSPVGPAVAPTQSASPTPKPTPPGDAVSAAARSAAAVQQITANLDRAAVFLDAGRYAPAKQQLDAAERKLGYVVDPAAKVPLENRLASLRALLNAAPAAQPSPAAQGGKPERGGKGHSSDTASNNENNGSSDKTGQGQSRTHVPTAAPSHGARTNPNGAPSVKPTAPAVHAPAAH